MEIDKCSKGWTHSSVLTLTETIVDVVKDKRTKNNNLEFLSLHESATGAQRHRPAEWWKQYQQELPDLARMTRQYLTVPATSASPGGFFCRVGLVQTDLPGRLLEGTTTDLTWAKQAS